MSKNYPTTNAELSQSSYSHGDAFFMTAKIEQHGDVTRVIVAPNMPVLVNGHREGSIKLKAEDVRDTISRDQGIDLLTRNDFSNGAADERYDGLFTLATGACLWLKNAGESRIVLTQNSLDKPVNPGRYNMTASGLVSGRDPVHQAQREFYEETCVLVAPSSGSVFTGLHFELPESLPTLPMTFEQAVRDFREPALKHIQPHLGEDGSVVWQPVATKFTHPEISDTVEYSILGNSFTTAAHVKLDPVKRSANIHYLVEADITGVVSGSSYAKLLLLDPEGFGKNPALFTLSEALVQSRSKPHDLIPAPADLIARLVHS